MALGVGRVVADRLGVAGLLGNLADDRNYILFQWLHSTGYSYSDPDLFADLLFVIATAVVGVTDRLVDHRAALGDRAVLVVLGLALLVEHGVTLLEQLGLHNRHLELAALLALDLLGLERENSQNTS